MTTARNVRINPARLASGAKRGDAFGRGEIAYLLLIFLYAALAWFAPNTQEIMGYDHENRKVGEKLGTWKMRPLLIYAGAAVLAFGILGIQQHSEFIYFRF